MNATSYDKARINFQRRFQPWPPHEHPVARNISWGGLDTENDITVRKTSVRVLNEQMAIQCVPMYRSVLMLCSLLAGTVLALSPVVLNALVFEVPPVEIKALRNIANEMAILFYGSGVLVVGLSAIPIVSRIRLATVDRHADKITLRQSRFLGYIDNILPRTSLNRQINLSDVCGLQIISYRSKDSYNSSHVKQYELNLVMGDGTRYLLTKQPGYKPLNKDAQKLAEFLQVPVWDRSDYYNPDATK